MKNKLTIFLMLLTILFIGNISIQAQGQIEVSSSVSGVITDGGTDNLGTSVDVGTQFTVTYTLTETATLDLTITSFSVTGVPSNCTIGTITPSVTLPTVTPLNNSSMTVDVPITVDAAGAFSFNIEIINTDADVSDQTFEITVSGTGIPGEIDVQRPAATSIADGDPDAVGNLLAGSGTTLTWTIEELNGSDIVVSAIAVGTTNNCGVSITDNPTSVTLNSSGTATETFDIEIIPTAAGVFSFQIDITSDDADEGNYDITVTGTGITIIPADGAVGVSIQPTFEWVDAATGIAVSTNSSYNPTVDIPEDWEIEEVLASVTTFDASTLTTTLLNNTTYYWWVEISSVWTLMGDFTTAQNVTPYLAAPVGGLQINSPTVQLYWNTSGYTGLLFDVFYSTTQKTTYAGDIAALQFEDLTNAVVSVAGLSPGVTYYWQVRAKTAAGAIVGYSTVESFVTYGVLSEPIPTYPINGSTSYTNEPYLYWTSYSYSTFIQYKVRYSTSSALTGDVLTSGSETALSYDLYTQLTGLDGGETYYWQVAATNDGGSTFEWSDLFSFTTPETAGSGSMLPPTPSYPTGGITVYSSSVTFYWLVSNYSATLQYQVRYAEDISTDGNGMLNDVSAVSLPMTSNYYKQVAGLAGDQTYYWQVRVYNGSTFGDWSVVDNFNTDESVLSVQTPILLTPSDGELVSVLQPTVFWYVSGVPSGYDFTVVYNDDGAQDISGNLTGTSNVLGSGTTSGFFAQFASALTNGETYYWQVIASKNLIDKYSAVRSFTVNASAPVTSAPIPIPTSPVGGLTVNTVNPVLNWAVNSSYSNLEFEVLYSTDGTTSGGVLQNSTTATAWTSNLAVTLSTALTPGATYYWQVRSRLISSPSTISDYSSVENFVVSASAGPVMAILGSPVGGIEIASTNPVLSWLNATPTSSSLKYDIEVADNPEMTAAQVIEDVTDNYTVLSNMPAGKTYYWRVRSKTDDGSYSYFTGSGEFTINNSITSVETENKLPSEFSLSQNYPNPFNPSTNIKFTLIENTIVSLKVYDILGREVITLVNENKQAGEFNVVWNGIDSQGNKVSSGTYIYRLVAGNNIETKKMVLLK